jgi:hypothetical protein
VTAERVLVARVAPGARARLRAALTLVMAAGALWWLWFSAPVLGGSVAAVKEWPKLVLLFFALPAALPALAALCWRGPATRLACALLAAGLFAAGLVGATVPVWKGVAGLPALARKLATVPVHGGSLTVWVSDCGATSCPPLTWVEQDIEVVRGLHRRWTIAERRPAEDARVRVEPGGRAEVTWLGEGGQPLAVETVALHESAWTG